MGKRQERAIEKLWRTHNGRPQLITDLVRSSIVCDTPSDIITILNRIRMDVDVGILRLKNRMDPAYNSRESGGYRNVSLNLIIVNQHARQECAEMHICELQV